ncbi:hypothetical protein BGZ70_001432 [Mortierella alpina]|uniref:Uncharacterized protein n=1 Tax=Mortierella alpina TaxID=64518 RepID=A0A9P6LY42_MORAP|nr:hypothetical protein BGZ70_001432 [Mortierella alpina]
MPAPACNSPTDNALQRFRLGTIVLDFEILTSDVSGEKGFIFLEDVQYAFDTKAARFETGTMAIPFMRGPDHRKYIPERIPCRPGVVVDIIEDPSTAPVIHQQPASPSSVGAAEVDLVPALDVMSQTLSIQEALPEPAVVDATPLPKEVAVVKQRPPETIQQSAHASASLAIPTRTSMAVAASTSDLIRLESLMSAANPEFKQFVHGHLEELVDKSEQVIRMQQEALDRLALVQTKAEAILIQNFELLEYTIPRLFIVLPETPGSKWNPANMLGTKFRLHFICECGEHTKRAGSKLPHHLHLAKHDGYAITQPSKFFVDYGPYLLVMLTLLKHGISIAGIVVPALATLKVVDVVDSVNEACATVTRQVIDGVDHSISFLEDFRAKELQKNEGSIDPKKSSQAEIAAYLMDVKGLEGADLRQLASYLSLGDSDNLLGNLYRITTKHGHVKWVCKDHYSEGYQAANNMRLCETVKAARGVIDEQVGKVVVSISSAVAAAQFYDALLKSQGIYELDLTLAWNQENADLTRLKETIKKSTITTLTLNLHLKSGPTFGINLTGKRRYDPILSMLKSPTLKSVHLRGVPADFFRRSGISPKDDYSNLKTFQMGEWASLERDSGKVYMLAARSPNLERMQLSVYSNEALVMIHAILLSRNEDAVPLKLQLGISDKEIWFEMIIPEGDQVGIEGIAFPEFLKEWGHRITILILSDDMTEENAVILAQVTTKTATKQSSLEVLDVERSGTVEPEQMTVGRAEALRKLVAQSPLKSLTVDMACAADVQVVSQIQWQHLRQLRVSNLLEAKKLPLSTLLRSMKAAGKDSILVEDFTLVGRGFDEEYFAQVHGVISLLSKLKRLVIANAMFVEQWLKLADVMNFDCLEYLDIYTPKFTMKHAEQFMAAIPLWTSLKTLVFEEANFGDELSLRVPVQVSVMKARGIRVVNKREKLD